MIINPFKKIKKIKDIVILGRGRSRLFYFDGAKNEINNTMLVNYESQDLTKKGLLYLSNKKVHIIFNIVEPHLEKNEIEQLEIVSTHVAIPWSMRILGIRKRINKKGNIYGNVKYMSHKIHKRWWLGNCGLIAIAHAVEVLGIKNIHLYGFDFYLDSGWAKESKQSALEFERENKYGKILKTNFLKYVKKNKQSNFFIKSHTRFEPMKNLFID